MSNIQNVMVLILSLFKNGNVNYNNGIAFQKFCDVHWIDDKYTNKYNSSITVFPVR